MKKLVVCADGTWKSDEAPNVTNVVWVVRALLQVDLAGVPQIIYYNRGVGTGPTDRLSGGAFGQGLLDNVKEGYRFLVNNYRVGDGLFLFGFSRGAYTVRSIVGLIRKCGLLRKEHANLLHEAYALYHRRDPSADPPDAVEFRSKYGYSDVAIDFLGVWDTVGSLGIPLAGLRALTLRKYQFHDVKLSRLVKRAYQALAIDERRKPFAPALWDVQPEGHQEVEQVWFAGVHSNVGGGYPDRRLSDLPLAWMIDKARAAGLAFSEPYLRERLAPDYRGTLYNSMTGFYRLTGAYERPLGTDRGGTEWVSRSAVRRQRDPALTYKAELVEAFLRAHPDRVYPDPQ